MKAELGVEYTLKQFRENEMPDAEHSLLFRLNNETVDCDLGDLEVSKFRPVKIKVGDPKDPVWAKDGDGKLQLFCAHTLKQWLLTVVPHYARLQSTNPFDNREIIKVQYLMQDEINDQISLYSQGEDEFKVLNVRLVKLREEKVEIENQIREFQAEGKSTRMKEALLNMKEQQIRTALLSLEQLRGSDVLHKILLQYDHTVKDGTLLPPLIAAVEAGDEIAVETLLKNKPDPDEVEAALKAALEAALFPPIISKLKRVVYGPPLNVALEAKDEDAANVLLDRGADPNEVDGGGWTALHRAAEKGCRLHLFHRILDKIVDVNAGNNNGMTALMWAAQFNHLDMVISLMNHPGIDVNVQGHFNYTALHFAVFYNHPAIVSQLLTDSKTKINLTNTRNETALDIARTKDNRDIINDLEAKMSPYELAMSKYRRKAAPINAALEAKDNTSARALLDGGDSPDAVDEAGNNALHIAATQDCEIALFNLILSKISNIDAKNSNEDTALMLAAYSNQLELVKRLMEENIDVNEKGGFMSQTALHWAVSQNLPAIVSQLLTDSRTDITLRNKGNKTALDIAVKDDNAVIVKLFLGHIDVNKFDKDGYTILIVAARDNRSKVVEALLENESTDVNIQSEKGNHWTALHWAVSINSPAIVRLLCSDKRTKLNIKDLYYQTPLEYAKHLNKHGSNREEIIAILTNAATNETPTARLKF